MDLIFLGPSANHSCSSYLNWASPFLLHMCSACFFFFLQHDFSHLIAKSSHLIHPHGVVGGGWQDHSSWHLHTIFFKYLLNVYLMGIARKFSNTNYIQKQVLPIIHSHGQKWLNGLLKRKIKTISHLSVVLELLSVVFCDFLNQTNFLGGRIKGLNLDSKMNHQHKEDHINMRSGFRVSADSSCLSMSQKYTAELGNCW